MFLASPVVNGFSRMQEHAADVYGLEVIHGIVPDSSEVAAQSFQVLGEVDLADPNPPEFITFWLYSHPPLADRLAFAHSYDPWSKGRIAEVREIAVAWICCRSDFSGFAWRGSDGGKKPRLCVDCRSGTWSTSAGVASVRYHRKRACRMGWHRLEGASLYLRR